MRFFNLIFVLFLFSGVVGFSQKVTKKHKVSKGETVYGISKKYGISTKAIYAMNPGSRNGIEVKSILLIPKEIKAQKHKVKKKETVYGICKDYEIDAGNLYAANPGLKQNGLKAGSVIIIPGNSFVVQSGKSVVDKNVAKETKSKKASKKTADKLVVTSKKYLGVPYVTGGTSRRGMDCSGLLYTVYGSNNIKLPRTSKNQSMYGKKIKASKASKGDLIFFKTSGRRKINHVGMVVEVKKGEVKFIHASTSRGVMISSLSEDYWKKRLAQVNRVID